MTSSAKGLLNVLLVDFEDSMENIGVTKDYHCGYCATFGCWTLKKEVMAGSALFQLRMDSCLKDMMIIIV
ncbi:hypothetical protein CICLE_v10003887mg [Citrus x clementina]|uniref:Uncharacterized protein n=1 Tax=Citrus clementina TaxID=85681 RepID=V4SWK1_CITCL|nr:hypothetical protein CICLE_v10003887mg [Citrus x clementina]